MSSSPTYTLVDQFDEDEFPDIPTAPAALLAALNTVTDPRKPRGLRTPLPGILANRGVRGQLVHTPCCGHWLGVRCRDSAGAGRRPGAVAV